MDLQAMMRRAAEGSRGPLPDETEYEICRRAAREGMVLLKNDGTLPLKDSQLALFGAGAEDTVICGTGSGSVAAPYTVSVRQGLEEGGYTLTSQSWLDRFREERERANAASSLSVIARLWSGMSVLIEEPEITEDDLKAAAGAETAVYVIRRNTGENFDRKNEKGDFLLSDRERSNLEAVAAAFSHTVVVLNTTVMDPRFLEEIPGIGAAVLMGLAGQEAGRALCDVLSGSVCPSGRLTDTWGRQYQDYPAAGSFSANDGDTLQEDYNEDIYVGYRWFDSFDITPFYPFGWGLSYTTFALSPEGARADGKTVSVKVSVTNTGGVSGREVVQLYVSPPGDARPRRPRQELKAFAKTRELSPGEAQTLELCFPTEALASFEEETSCEVIPAGDFVLRVGRNSRDTVPAAVVRMEGRTVTKRLSPLAACDKPLNLISPPENVLAEDLADVPVYTLSPSAFETQDLTKAGTEEILTYVPEGTSYVPYAGQNSWQLPYPLPERVVPVRNVPKATLWDVHEGRVSLPEFTASLDTGTLLRLVTGTASETPHPVETRMPFPVSPTRAIPSSGQTTAQYTASLGIPNSYLTDGPAGLHVLGVPTAAWPVGMTLAQTWDVDLIQEVGSGFGTEMEAYHQSVILGPGMNLHRDPLCGRCFEYYSEDPVLTGLCAAAFTRGVQSHEGCMVSLKHFACNNQETDRAVMNVSVSQRALRNLYLKGFEIAVKESRPGTVMTSYNQINGRHTSENRELLEGILRGEWGFDGLVMTDWNSQSYKPGDLHAGNDLIMGGLQVEYLECALEGTGPVFNEDGSVEEIVNMAYGGMMRQSMEHWGAFLPEAGGEDTWETKAAAGVPLGERVKAAAEAGIAELTPCEDGGTLVTYHGTDRGRHLALGDLQRSAMRVLTYLMRSLAWKDMVKNAHPEDPA